MNYGYGPAMPWSYGSQWGNQSTTSGMGNNGMGFGLGPPSWNNFGTFPSTGFAWTPMTDDELEYFVEQSIDNDPSIPSHANIEVDVQDGIVTLTGTVPNKRIKHAAGDDAWWLPQVIDVHNTIQVQPRKMRTGANQGRATSQSTRRGMSGR